MVKESLVDKIPKVFESLEKRENYIKNMFVKYSLKITPLIPNLLKNFNNLSYDENAFYELGRYIGMLDDYYQSFAQSMIEEKMDFINYIFALRSFVEDLRNYLCDKKHNNLACKFEIEINKLMNLYNKILDTFQRSIY